jgi:hypothetical protein
MDGRPPTRLRKWFILSSCSRTENVVQSRQIPTELHNYTYDEQFCYPLVVFGVRKINDHFTYQCSGSGSAPKVKRKIRIRINLQITSQNVLNMNLWEHFFKVLSIYLHASIWIRIRIHATSRIRIRIKVTSRLRIRQHCTIPYGFPISDSGYCDTGY